MDKQQTEKEITLKALQQALTVCDNCTPKPEGVMSNLRIAIKAHKERKMELIQEINNSFKEYYSNSLHITELHQRMENIINNL